MSKIVTRTVCLLGFGNVGRRFCELVARQGDELADDHGLRVLFSAVGTGSHGSLLAPDGLTAQQVLDPVEPERARGRTRARGRSRARVRVRAGAFPMRPPRGPI